MANTTVDDWLRSLNLLNYVQAFIDNGYDDLDICKQIGDEDLDAIGVINAKDRKDILLSVQSLKDQGVNAVYFQLEANTEPTISNKYITGQTDREKYRRDDLITKMKSLLVDDNCVLPENNPNIEHDPLDDLAQYYADQLYTYFQDVKEVLEYLRDGESNEGGSIKGNSPPSLPVKQGKAQLNLLQERGLSKSLNSLETGNAVKSSKGSKSPKHSIRHLFGGSKKKNNVNQPHPKISGPMETAHLMSNVQMSDEDRKSLMLQVKHGDKSLDEAMNDFYNYEASHKDLSREEKEKSIDKKEKKKKSGFFNRSSFKRRSSGQSSEILAADIQLGEKDRMELMRKIKNGEITSEEAWDQLRRCKRDSKVKSPKAQRKGSKSPKQRERISASSVQLFNSSTFYAGANVDFSQSTSNIPSIAAGSDSSPDSTPGLPRKLEGYNSEQLGSSGSIDTSPGNYSSPRQAPAQNRNSSPKNVGDLRRVVSEKRSSLPKEPQVNGKRRSTLSNVESNRSSTSSLNEGENTEGHSPNLPVRKPPRLPAKPPHKPHTPPNETKPRSDSLQSRSSSNEGKKPKIAEKPALPAKPKPKPPAKPHRLTTGERTNSLPKNTKPAAKVPLVSLVNGQSSENVNVSQTRTAGEATSSQSVAARRVPPAKPSPETRVSRHKPSGTKLLEMIEQKLDEEGIDLTQEPYSNQDGNWGVPMALIDRYSCELQSTMREVTKEIDHIRIEKLHAVNKTATHCDLTNLRFAPDVVGKLTSVVDWLTSLGLPMYIDNLMEEGYDDMHVIPYLSQEHLNYANITKHEHVDRLIRSLENMAPDTSYNGD